MTLIVHNAFRVLKGFIPTQHGLRTAHNVTLIRQPTAQGLPPLWIASVSGEIIVKL